MAGSIPIDIALNNPEQIALARLQDLVVQALFETEPSLIMHGGTAIWRCYSGNRFSYDIDLYATEIQMKRILGYFTWSLSKRGIKMDYPALSGRTIYAYNDTGKVKIEAMPLPRGLKGLEKDFELTTGSSFIINTLSIDRFMEEKITTYGKRHYERDLYDLYHLSTIKSPSAKNKKSLRGLITRIEPPIKGPGELKGLIYSGVTPSFSTMVNYLKGKSK